MAPWRFDRGLRWNDVKGEEKLGMVADRGTCRATLDPGGSLRDHTHRRQVAQRGGHRIPLGIDDAAQSPEGRRGHEIRPTSYGTVYRRTRPDETGVKRQRAEIRFDDVAGCLRTPAGGSSRQTIIVVEGKRVRSRLLSTREAARLMGLRDDYLLPERYNDAYHVCGDGVCAPVVRHVAAHLLEPLLRANEAERIAAE